MLIRPMAPDEARTIRAIETASGVIFRDVGMGMIADMPAGGPAPDEQTWVLADGDRLVAFARVSHVDGRLHLEQLSTHPDFARRGLAAELIEHVVGLAREQGLPAVTLTTYAEVPWNQPYYERCGFAVLPEPEWTPGLRAIREHEISLGLDRWPRVVMSRSV